jgi:hypothetical protein
MRVMQLKGINILFAIILVASAEAQDVKVTASFDTSRIYIGDQIGFSIIVDQPADISLSLPFFKDTLNKNIEIVTGPVYDSVRSTDNRLKIVEKYRVTSFDSGHYQLPPVFAELKNDKGLKRFYSDYSQLEVLRVKIAPPDTTVRIFDIIKPYRAPVAFGEILPWILLLAIAVTAVWFLIRLIWKLKKPKTGLEPFVIRDPAHVVAFRELEKLRDEMLWQKGETKKYYTRLTEILRQYLEDRFRIFSLELTTSETLQELLKTGFKKDESYNKLKEVLTGADLVKFAKYRPLQDENELHFENSWKFVQMTKVVEENISQSPINAKEGEGVS